MRVTPEKLLERYLVGDDEDAMEGLVRATRPRLLRAARRICAGEAEDAVQAAYLELVKKGPAALELAVLPWLMTVVVRGSYRRRARRAREHDVAARLAAPRGPEPPVHGAIGREEAQLLRREVWRLPERYRDPLVLHYLHGLTMPETARLLDLNESTLRTRVQRGRTLLRSRLARVLYPLVALPWLLADAAGATAPVLGGVMKTKAALATVAVLVLASLTAVGLGTRESAPARPRADLEPRAPALSVAGAGSAPAAPDAATRAPGPAYATGVVVDTAGHPVPDVRLIVRRSAPDAKLKAKLETVAAKKKRKLGARAHYRPRPIDDDLRAAAPLARSDATGAFRIGKSPGELASLLFVKEGYAIREVTEPVDGVRVVLDPARELAGIVTDTDGRPIAGARIRADHPGQSQITHAGADGRYLLRTMPAGVTHVFASAWGYRTGDAPAPARVTDFRLERRWLVVDVADPDGRPIAGSNAILLAPDGRRFRPGGGHRTPAQDPDAPPGHIVLGPDPASLLEETETVAAAVTVFAPGYRPAREPVTFRRGQEPPHLAVTLRRGDGPPSIAGHVAGATGAHVVVRDAWSRGRTDYRLVTEANADPDGRFHFSGLPSGWSYLVVVTAPGTGKVSREVEAPATDLMIHLAPAARLEAVVTDRSGAPAPGAHVHVGDVKGKRYWNAETDARGRALFADLPEGQLHVTTTVTPQTRSLEGIRSRVTLRAGETARVELVAPERVPFRLTVRDQHGNARTGLRIRFEPRTGVAVTGDKKEWVRVRGMEIPTAEDGTVQAELYEGGYEVRVGGMRAETVAVDGDGAVEIVVPVHDTVVRGRVLEFGTDRPLSDRSVSFHIVGRRGGQAADARTDGEGRIEMRNLPPGDVWVGCPGPKHFDTHSGAGARIELAAGAEREVVLVLVPLRGPDVPPTPVTLDVETSEPARVIAWAKLRDGWTRVGTRQTDAAGRATLEVIAAERYRVDASASGGKYASRSVAREGYRIPVFVDVEAK